MGIIYRATSESFVASPVPAPRGPIAPGAVLALGVVAVTTNYQETLPLLWALTIISVVGAAVTFGALLYAILRFRDPSTRGRRYG
jgi:hypothetical protein